MVSDAILEVALAAYAGTAGTSRVAMKAALEAAFARPEEPITEEWLRSVGFKWHEFERSGGKHWLLWLAGAFADGFTSFEDLGIELTSGTRDGTWFCWLRGDYSHRYSRFIHIRHLRTQAEVIQLVEACTGLPWNPENHRCGSVRTEKQMEWFRREDERLDRRLMRESHPWRDIEKDDSRGGALPEHMQAAIDAGKAK